MKTAPSILLLTAFVLATPFGLEAAQRSEDVEVLVITTASNRGEVDPCG